MSSMSQLNEKWNSTEPQGQWLASNHVDGAKAETEFRIDGWLAAQGTAVWFGPGSTGKTQLLLWMSALIASKARPAYWLGHEVHGTGHVLILSAEDSRDHIVGRLRDVLTHTMGQDDCAARATCERIHVMPFLSMTEEQFEHPNASMMHQIDRNWEPSPVLLEIRRYIEDWNGAHEDAEDKIVGVVMDSATSMAGFDSIDGFATTNFFFYLGRLCEALGIFWTVIGHQPKGANPGQDPRKDAAARLRGAAMWTTAPRMTVEVRLIQENKKWREAAHIRDAYPDRSREDFVVVYVAKANLQGVHRDERYLLRSRKGAFEDVTTDPPAEVAVEPTFRTSKRKKATHKGDMGKLEAAGTAQPKSKDWRRGTELIALTIKARYPEIRRGDRIFASKIQRETFELFPESSERRLILDAHGGNETPAREGAINWHLERLADTGMLVRDNKNQFRFEGWTGTVDEEDRAAEPTETEGFERAA